MADPRVYKLTEVDRDALLDIVSCRPREIYRTGQVPMQCKLIREDKPQSYKTVRGTVPADVFVDGLLDGRIVAFSNSGRAKSVSLPGSWEVIPDGYEQPYQEASLADCIAQVEQRTGKVWLVEGGASPASPPDVLKALCMAEFFGWAAKGDQWTRVFNASADKWLPSTGDKHYVGGFQTLNAYYGSVVDEQALNNAVFSVQMPYRVYNDQPAEPGDAVPDLSDLSEPATKADIGMVLLDIERLEGKIDELAGKVYVRPPDGDGSYD